MSRRTIALAPLLVLAVLMPASALGGGAATDGSGRPDPDGATAKTNKGGFCRLDAIAARAGGSITFGGQIRRCDAKFGIRQVVGRGLLYEEINTARTVADTGRAHGGIPYELTASFQGQANDFYEGRFDVTVVINGGKSLRKPRKPEKWTDPGRGCRVMSTRRASDTLGCIFGKELPP